MDLASDAPAQSMTEGAPLPRYAEIRRELETAILSGRWPPGHRVPSEHELVVRYGCSRMTVNKALSALAAAGLIVRRRRAGSFVATPEADESILEIRDMGAEARREGVTLKSLLERMVNGLIRDMEKEEEEGTDHPIIAS